MTVPITPNPDVADDREVLMSMGLELQPSEEGSAPNDPYAVNELLTRQERTERAIRQAQEQF